MKNILVLILSILCLSSAIGQTTDATLTTQAQQIRNETVAGQNTAVRVGTHLQNLVYSKKSFFSDGTASGTNTYAVTLDNGAVTTLSAQWFVIKFTNGNSSDNPTLNINAIGGKLLKKNVTDNLEAGDIVPGSIHLLAYDGSNLQVLSIGGVTSIAWGNIEGTLSDQSDLNSALGAKQATLVSGTNIKTINGSSLLGSGDLTISTAAELIIGTTTITSGANTKILFNNSGVVGEYTISGSGNVAMTTSPVFTTPNLGTPSAIVLTNGTGLPLTSITGMGIGVSSALGVNVGSAGSFVTFNGALGTPSSGTATNLTGLPILTGVSGLGSNVATFLSTPSSANLRSALTDESGTGVDLFAGTPGTNIGNTPAGNIAATDVQTALNELDTEKLSATATIIGKQDIFIGAGAINPSAVDGCSTLTPREISPQTIYTLKFDPTTSESGQFGWVPPRNWDHGTVQVIFHWTASAGSGGVTWGAQAVAFSDNDAFGSAFGTAQTVSDTFLAADKKHTTSATSAITTAGSPTDLDLIFWKFYRDTANGSDTLASDAELIGVTLVIGLDASVSE